MSINNPLNPLNLSNGTYFIRTSDTQNPYLGIRGLDDIVSKGVFSFLLNGSTYLQQGSDIQFEAIDSQGNQISIGGVRNLLKGTSRVVSFEIDDRISNGEATLYISTNLSSYLDNGIETDVPSQFVDVPNLLFEYKFQVDKSRVNTDEIIFRKPPTLTVTPSLKTVRDITKTSTTTSTLSGDIKQYYYDDSSASYTLLIESESGTYSFDMNGGVATISNNVDLTIQGIVNVIDSSTIFTTIQNPDIEVYSKEQFKGILSSPISFTISYITIPDISDTRLQETAIAGIEINDMGVVSGDVAKIKIFGKSDSLNSNYVLLSEVDVENKNLLELEGTGSVGIFDTSKKVGAWSVSKEQVGATDPTITSNDDIFLSGLVINGDYDSPTTVEINGRTLQTPRYVLESDIDLQLKKNIEYNLRLNASVSDVSATDTRLDVYVKSSSITSDNKFGKLIHSFRADSDKIWRDQFSIVFLVDSNTTDGELVFVTTSGRWYLQDIRLTANIQDGFSPQEFRTEIPLNITKPSQDIDFKVEFFDANNNKAEKVLTKDNVIFERPNIVVEGTKNVTVGEMYLGQDSGSGVITGGSGNGGIVKSFGYEGFAESTGVDGVAGFLMYSGSVLTGSATTYQGVGLELVASSESFFRYRTNPSELDIRTNKFFIGQEATQFISGADSNIEISSSLFHLDPKNNLLVIGTDAVINADLTVNEIRTPALIDGSPSTTANASSSINSDGFAKFVSASIGGFDVSETQINSTNDNLVLKSNGQITGSTVLFDGGVIAGFNLSSDAIGGDGYYISGSATGNDFFISSSNFNVKANGDVTGSRVLFTGGTISGSDITFDVTQFVAKGDTVEISGSNFHLLNGNITASNVDLSGNITAETGNIGGFSISADALSGNGFYLSGSATDNDFFISSSNFNVKANGDITGSQVLFTGGKITGSNITFDVENFIAKGDNVEISGSNFHLLEGNITASNVDLTGNISANTGNIGNFQIIDGKISGSNITLDANNSTIFKTDQGPGSDPQSPGFEYLADEYYIDFTPVDEDPDNFFVKFGPNFMVDKDGILIASGATFEGTITASAGKLGGFNIGDDSIFADGNTIFISGSPSSTDFFISSSNFNVKGNGDITGSNVLFTGGKITGSNITFDVTDFVAKGDSVEISGSNFHLLEGNITASNVDLSGTITATAGEIGGFTISEDALSSNNFFLSGSATGDDFFISASNMNIKADGQITGSEVLFTGGTVGGFTITDTFISASNLEINSDGTIQTPNFADGVRGFQITALGNGSAQFENVKIRGTLRTTVFEKETVNAVGGQLWVANSTVLSQSVTSGETTMSVENVTGFEVNEILLIKKVDGTGFSSEYVLVESSSRTDGASDTNLSGELYVQRAYADGLPTGSDVTWVTELASSAQNYSDGQVIVSTGKQDTGWILLNASPNNTYTPYIDIVERTGSGVYDYELKARLGDLSGLSTTRLLGNNPATAGFGLYSENVFLEGGIRATFGEIGGFGISDTTISSSNDDLILRSNGQITGSAFLLGDTSKTGNYIEYDGGNLVVNGTINIVGGNAATTDYVNTVSQSLTSSITTVSSSAATDLTSTSQSIDGTITSNSSSIASDLTSTSESIDSTITDVSSSLSSSISDASSSLAGDLTSTSSSLASDLTSTSSSIATDIVTNSNKIVTDANAKIVKPIPTPSAGAGLYLTSTEMGFYDNSEFKAFISSSGDFLFKKDDNNLVSFGNDSFILNVSDQATISGSNINLLTPTFFFGTDTAGQVNYISGSNGNLEISSSNFVIDESGNVTVSGDITITSGDLAGIDANSISGSFTEVSESIDGTITSNSSSIAGDLTSTSESIDSTITSNSSSIAGDLTTTSSSINTTITNVSSSLSSSITDASSSLASDLTSTSSSLAGDLTSTSSSLASDVVSNADKIVTDANNKIVKPNDAPATGNGLYLSSNYLGYYSSSGDWNAYISSSGEFLFRADDNNLVSFADDGFVLKTETATISGSSVNLVTPTFFFGTDTPGNVNYISGSNNNLEISSSNFELNEDGSVRVSGEITITSGDLAGIDANTISGSFTEVSESIDGTISNVSESLSSSLSDVSQSLSSSLSSVSGSLATDVSTNAGNITTNASKIVTDANNKIVVPNDAPTGAGLFLSERYLGYYNNSNWTAYISSSGEFLFKEDDNNLVSLDEDGFVLKTETATISGSEINLVTDTFFFGTDTPGSVNYISGSNSNLEISSSNFVLAQNGDVSITGDITSSAAQIKGNSTIAGFEVTDTQINDTDDNLILKSNGQITASAAQISGNITINNPGDINTGDLNNNAGFTDDTAADAAQADATDAQDRVSNYETQVVLDTNGMSLKNQAGTVTLASYGTTTTIGQDANDQSRIFIDSDSVDLIVDTGGTDVVEASFGATTTIGGTSGQHISIDSDSFDVKTDATTTIASFGSTTTVGNTTGQHVSIDSDSFDIKTDATTTVATFGANTTLTGGTITLRNTTNNNDKVVISENSFQVFDNNNVVASFGANTVLEGGTVTIRNTTNNNDKVEIGENYFRIFDNGTEVAEFGATTTIGDTTTEHVEITSTGLKLKDGGTERLVMDENGITIGTEVTISSDGTATFGGELSAPSGDIGGFTIGNDVLSNGTTFGISGSSTGDEFFISSSTFNVKANGNMTASNAQITGDITATSGQIAKFSINDTTLQVVTGSSILQLGELTNIDSGDLGLNISGSNYYFDISTTQFGPGSSDFYPRIEMYDTENAAGMYAGIIGDLTSSFGAGGDEFNFVVLGNGNKKLFSAGAENIFAGFEFTSTQINDTGDNLILKSNGQITGSAAQITGDITANTIEALSGNLGNLSITGSIDIDTNGVIESKGTSDWLELSADALELRGRAVYSQTSPPFDNETVYNKVLLEDGYIRFQSALEAGSTTNIDGASYTNTSRIIRHEASSAPGLYPLNSDSFIIEGVSSGIKFEDVGGDIEFFFGTNNKAQIDSSGNIQLDGTLTISGISTDNSETYAVMIDNSTGVVSKRGLSSNAFTSTNIAVSSYTNGSNNRIVTSTGTAGINGESNLTFDGTDLTITNGNVNVSDGYGIDFSATGQAAGMTDELLDDYEEGTWSPEYKYLSYGFPSTVGRSGTMDVLSATYTKIGRVVYIRAYIRSDGMSFSTPGTLVIDNLPFNSASGNDGYSSVSVGFVSTWGGDYPLSGYVQPGNDYIRLLLRTSVNTSATAEVSTNDLSSGTDANRIIISGFYFT